MKFGSSVQLKLGAFTAYTSILRSIRCLPSVLQPLFTSKLYQKETKREYSTKTWSPRASSTQKYSVEAVLPDAGVLIYRWPTMKHFRFISKVKVYQVGFMVTLLPLTAHWHAMGALTAKEFVLGGVALVGTGAVLAILSHYFRKLAGEIRYNLCTNTLRVSTLTFWGNRRDLDFPADKVVMFVESQTRMGSAFQQLEIMGRGETFLWSLRYGRVLDLELLCRALKITDTDLSHF